MYTFDEVFTSWEMTYQNALSLLTSLRDGKQKEELRQYIEELKLIRDDLMSKEAFLRGCS